MAKGLGQDRKLRAPLRWLAPAHAPGVHQERHADRRGGRRDDAPQVLRETYEGFAKRKEAGRASYNASKYRGEDYHEARTAIGLRRSFADRFGPLLRRITRYGDGRGLAPIPHHF